MNKQPDISLACMEPLVQLWLLRLLVPLEGFKKGFDRDSFDEKLLASLAQVFAVDLESCMVRAERGYVEFFNPGKVLSVLDHLYTRAEKTQKYATAPACLVTRVQRLSELFGLSATDCRILEFAVLIHTEEVLAQTGHLLGDLKKKQLFKVLSAILGLPLKNVRNALGDHGALSRSGLLSLRQNRFDSRERLSSSLVLLVLPVLLPEDFAEIMASIDLTATGRYGRGRQIDKMYAEPAEDQTVSSAGVEPLVQLWLLRLLVPLNAFGIAHPWDLVFTWMELPASLRQTFAMDIESCTKKDKHGDRKLNRKKTLKRLDKLYTRAEKTLKYATAPACLATKVQGLSELFGLTATDCRILEFAVLIRTEEILGITGDWLGALKKKQLFKTLSVILGLPLDNIRNALRENGALSRSGLLHVRQNRSDSRERLSNSLELLWEDFDELERYCNTLVLDTPDEGLAAPEEDYGFIDRFDSLANPPT